MTKLYVTAFCAFAPGYNTVYDWRRWAQNEATDTANKTETPDVSFVPAMTRRKLSQLAKMVLHTARAINPLNQSMPNVFSSRYGEWEQLAKQLKRYFTEHDISPGGFSLSVHNATSGTLSILQQNRETYTTIAAGRHSFDMGLLEAASRLSQNDLVAYYYAEEKIPDIYRGIFKEDIAPFALGLLLSHTKTKPDDIGLELTFDCNITPQTENNQHVMEFMRFILTSAAQFTGKNLLLTKLTD